MIICFLYNHRYLIAKHCLITGVQSLNGSVLDGKEISVGRAKENIIDKIRREKQEKLEPVAVEADIPVFNKPYQYPTPREQVIYIQIYICTGSFF